MVFDSYRSLGLAAPHASYSGGAQTPVPSCWSCLVMLERGAVVCPFCGADQTRPVPMVDLDLRPPITATRIAQEYRYLIAVILVLAISLAGILWRNFREPNISPASQAAGVAAKSLNELREALTAYALASRGTYPSTLKSLGDRASLPMEAAVSAGYRIEYSPTAPSGEAVFRGFVILARPEKSDFLNLRVDESGLVRATEKNRPATEQDPPY
jgi:hypothetical protein